MLMLTDPIRQWNRLFDQGEGPSATMDAYRQGDVITMVFDLPGVDPSQIDVQIEQGELRLTARRKTTLPEGARYIIRERADATITRRVMLGEVLDVEHVDAEYRDGVLVLRVPMHESAKARKVTVRSAQDERAAINVSAS